MAPCSSASATTVRSGASRLFGHNAKSSVTATMRLSFLTLLPGVLALVTLSVVCAIPASLAPVRAIPVYQKPQRAGSTHDYYSCDSSDLSPFTSSIATSLAACEAKTSFNFSGDSLPYLADRYALCDCRDMINELQEVTLPRCWVTKSDYFISYAAFFSYSFGLCFTTTPARTQAASTPAPSRTIDTSSSDAESSSTPVIAGLVGGGVFLLVLAFVIIQCRKKNRSEPSGGVVYSKGDTGDDGEEDNAIVATPLSPLGEDPASDFVTMANTPKQEDESSTTATNNTSSVSSGLSSRHNTKSVDRASMNAAVGINSARSNASNSSGGVSSRSTTSSAGTPARVIMGLNMWEDPVIVAVRIPQDTIFFGPLLARGGFGEVHKGTYKGETVAIKQLLPSTRKDLAQINAFLSEAKLMSSLDHERIVRFIGVAWNSLSDACAVVEFMENGDLRSVLTRWDTEEMRPRGFDADKVKIALHIAHALTYLHSLQPVVVHRDLKSKNILLTSSYDAKLTDFGVSRERADSTMTAGVGSSLWMAPEVMMGERYNEKADVFSYGVVLSELDTQQLPYAGAKDAAPDYKIPDSALLQMVMMGRLRVAFTDHADAELVQLAYDCVQLEPAARPSIAEVLHRVHLASRRVV